MRISDWSSDVCSSDLMEGSSLHPNQQGPDKGQSVKLQFDLAGAAPHRADHDLHVMAQPGHQLQQFGLADAAKLAARDARNLGLVDPQQRSRIFLRQRSEEHTSELQSLMSNSYDVFCLKKTTQHIHVISLENSL